METEAAVQQPIREAQVNTTQPAQPEQGSQAVPALSKNPEPLYQAVLKDAANVAGNFVLAAATPMQEGQAPVVQVDFFDKKQESEPPLSFEAMRQKNAEQLQEKREQKAARPGGILRAQKPIEAKERQIRRELQTIDKKVTAPVKIAA